ncbi:Aste57867_21461 [Aphanomyces stellatus]|uniref:Aste57867_21461 protein n=1 Tax=Aphanomyces stellatus TaxID=120398 RepID=A0A485LHI6_9STRA|nr:hypothetical protein As57867_021392 [Aphanomyces stellatus]VFT98132.1 Aste57867_21461 [Aphanomyces stellatus]
MAEAAPLFAVSSPRRLTLSKTLAVASCILVLVTFRGLVHHHNLHASPDSATSLDKSASFDGDLRLRCNLSYVDQPLDHFTTTLGTFRQRYFTCGIQWQAPRGPIFFYAGHDADVEVYLNHSGLLWENAAEFGALLVFAEHRYFGQSRPAPRVGESFVESLRFLSSEQALGDYVALLRHLKKDLGVAPDAPVVAFGGAYGGMLAAWMRLKYPFAVDGAIAASAPLLAFDGQSVDFEAFARIVTADASTKAGASKFCVPNIRRAQRVIATAGTTPLGRQNLAAALGLCDAPTSLDDALRVSDTLVQAYGALATANYPYETAYFGAALPANPLHVACAYLDQRFTTEESVVLLESLRASVGVWLNATGTSPCYNVTSSSTTTLWSYLWCSELYMPFDQDGKRDFFIRPHRHDPAADATRCRATWGVELRPEWAATQYGGLDGLRASSNIVFSNGNLDPWSAYGVRESLSSSLTAVSIDGGAHQLDLMFPNPLDPDSVRDARRLEMAEVAKWIQAKQKKSKKPQSIDDSPDEVELEGPRHVIYIRRHDATSP